MQSRQRAQSTPGLVVQKQLQSVNGVWKKNEKKNSLKTMNTAESCSSPWW